jgi:hypothetical protein
MNTKETILCSECGITLMPFMTVCPRCGAAREDAEPLREPSPSHGSGSLTENLAEEPDRTDRRSVEVQRNDDGSNQNKPVVVPLEALHRQRPPDDRSSFAPTRDLIFLSPADTHRRFPLFTAGQLTLMAIGAGLLILMLVIAYLLWRQNQRDLSQAATSNSTVAQTVASPTGSAEPVASPTPAPVDDQTISEQVKSALMAYSPLGYSRYKFEVKDGVVTINGEAEHQPEKDGVDNILKLIVGVRSVVNNLKLNPNQPFAPVKLNVAEAKILDEALRRQVEASQNAPVDQPAKAQPADAQREAAARAAAKQREEEAAMRKAVEDKLRREAEDYERRQDELRRAEAERRARAEQARLEAAVLRSGTVAWSGVVDGVDEIIITGSSASVRHISGNPPREVKASFSAPIPRSPATVTLLSANGRGSVSVAQQPSAANGYTTIVRIDDSAKGGDKLYEFTLRWSLQ